MSIRTVLQKPLWDPGERLLSSWRVCSCLGLGIMTLDILEMLLGRGMETESSLLVEEHLVAASQAGSLLFPWLYGSNQPWSKDAP